MTYLALIVYGLLAGSFINVFVDRTQQKRDFIKGRSSCDHCRKTLAWYDLIPIFSWLSTLGKCRYCRIRLSIQYPVVELFTAFIFISSYLYWPNEISSGYEITYFILWLLASILLISLFVYDIKWLTLPDSMNWPLVLVSIVAVSILGSNDINFVIDRIGGVAVGWGFFYFLVVISKGKWIGGGDVKLAISIGLWLGALKTLVALIVGFYSATFVVVPLLMLKIIKRKQLIPFGPFLIFGLIVTMFFGNELIDWYKDLVLNVN